MVWEQVSAEDGRVIGLFLKDELRSIRGAHVAEVRREPLKRMRGAAPAHVIPQSYMRFYCYILRADGEWAPYGAAPFKGQDAAKRALQKYGEALLAAAARKAAAS